MSWVERIAGAFPDGYGEEPPGLRRDIADELADHLECAYRRELLRTRDEAAARRAVLAKFGDPAAVARKLWFEAMKEQVMGQRMMIVLMAVLTVAVLGGLVLGYLGFQQMQRQNEAFLARLEAMGQPPAASAAPGTDLVRLKVRLVEETPDGKPVVGWTVKLEGKPFTEQEETLEEQTDAEGIAGFGPIRPGRYNVVVATASRYVCFREILLYGGIVREETILCPPEIRDEPEKVEVSMKLQAPEDLRGRELWAECRFRPPEFKMGECLWTHHEFNLLVSPEGHIYRGQRHNFPVRGSRREPEETWSAPAGSYCLVAATVLSTEANTAQVSPRQIASCSYKQESSPRFEALPNGQNAWAIVLPDEVWAKAREGLSQLPRSPVPIGPMPATMGK
ncbi:MAG: hypothetical protein GXY33_20770 [Phycisphaerae bacterium]|nr:hypothetical protein [Phycisphaerae bacterium]